MSPVHAGTENTTPKMDAELKVKWVAALRSGQYKQGRGSMRPDGAYCCLAVLREVGALEDVFLTVREPYELIQMNDGGKGFRQHSFAEIADWIEANL